MWGRNMGLCLLQTLIWLWSAVRELVFLSATSENIFILYCRPTPLSPLCPPCPDLFCFFVCVLKSEVFKNASVNNLVGMTVWTMDARVCPFVVSLTHRLFMWLCGGWPLPSSASHPHPRDFHSARAWLGGKLELFCSEGFLGEAVKALTVWAFISPEKRRGRIDRGKRASGIWGLGGTKESLDTDSLVSWSPQRGVGWEGKETWKKQSKSKNELSKKPQNLPCVTSPQSFASAFPLFLHSSLSAPSICFCVSSLFSSITCLCPPPHPASPSFHPSPLLYTHSIIKGDQAKRDVWGRRNHYHRRFPLHCELQPTVGNRRLNHNQ